MTNPIQRPIIPAILLEVLPYLSLEEQWKARRVSHLFCETAQFFFGREINRLPCCNFEEDLESIFMRPLLQKKAVSEDLNKIGKIYVELISSRFKQRKIELIRELSSSSCRASFRGVSQWDFIKQIFNQIPPRLKKDREIILAAIEGWPKAMDFISPKDRDDREFILAAVKRNGLCLKIASATCRNDREIVLEAVKRTGLSLKHASLEFRNDQEIVEWASSKKKQLQSNWDSMRKNQTYKELEPLI